MKGPGPLLARRDCSASLYEVSGGRARVEASFLSTDHLIWLRLEIDPKRQRVTRAEAGMEVFPCRRCPKALPQARRLRGLRLDAEAVDETSRRLGGAAGCLHLRELGRTAMAMAAEALIGYPEGFGLLGTRNGDLFHEMRRELVERHWKGRCIAYPADEGDVCRECLECTHACGRGERRRARGALRAGPPARSVPSQR